MVGSISDEISRAETCALNLNEPEQCIGRFPDHLGLALHCPGPISQSEFGLEARVVAIKFRVVPKQVGLLTNLCDPCLGAA